MTRPDPRTPAPSESFRGASSGREGARVRVRKSVTQTSRSTDRIVRKFKVEGDIDNGIALGYDKDGNEVIKVPLKEPVIIRKEYDQNLDVRRLSVT